MLKGGSIRKGESQCSRFLSSAMLVGSTLSMFIVQLISETFQRQFVISPVFVELCNATRLCSSFTVRNTKSTEQIKFFALHTPS